MKWENKRKAQVAELETKVAELVELVELAEESALVELAAFGCYDATPSTSELLPFGGAYAEMEAAIGGAKDGTSFIWSE